MGMTQMSALFKQISGKSFEDHAREATKKKATPTPQTAGAATNNAAASATNTQIATRAAAGPAAAGVGTPAQGALTRKTLLG
jgi:hypothetical protein